ncbi:acyl carrier protein phosphodiesterase [Spartinivicinus sp. A2-2]|uniref:Acyl carrier protein phosphodiesterase n=2 Tax=Spartinivicinus poritis TaxID=2994640 RepID=A0ABT5U3B9_9GAMM|nr:acyl carrier protein phosphodiesterase [Spartinivicinus sp. A2-2]MDE1460868.1 acyl carrier protein phosphodiesterase [Spartinivicinus sp. A2-2]
MGDFCKGVDLNRLPEAVKLGIYNHRAVDRFTDNHVVVQGLKPLFDRRFRRFSGIITDVIFDHFLIKHWSTFSDTPLHRFIEHSYNALWLHRQWMPAPMTDTVGRIIEHNGLMAYGSLEGVRMTLLRLSQRIRFDNPLAESQTEILKNYTKLDDGFLQFFPELIEYIDHLAIEVENAQLN